MKEQLVKAARMHAEGEQNDPIISPEAFLSAFYQPEQSNTSSSSSKVVDPLADHHPSAGAGQDHHHLFSPSPAHHLAAAVSGVQL